MKWLVQFFHRFPHFNLSLVEISDVFDPEDIDYLQALGLLVIAPLLLLGLFLFILLIVWIARCCSKPGGISKRYAQVRQFSNILFLLDLVCCVFVGVCIFANEKINRGSEGLVDSLYSLAGSVGLVENKINLLNTTISRNVELQLTNLSHRVLGQLALRFNRTMLAFLTTAFHDAEASLTNVTSHLSLLKDVSESFATINSTARTIEHVEYDRWSIGVVVGCLILIILFIGLVSFCRHSLSSVILFSVSGIFVFLSVWCVAGLSLGYGVALGDLCTNPDPFLRSLPNTALGREAVDYYLHCAENEDSLDNPLQDIEKVVDQSINNVESLVLQLGKLIDSVVQDAQVHDSIAKINSLLNDALKSVGHLIAVLDCDTIHALYVKAANNTCNSVVAGVGLMLLGSVCCGLFLFILLCMTSKTWPLYKHRRNDYVEVQNESDHDPFMPPIRRDRDQANNVAISADFYGSHIYNPRGRPLRQETTTTTASALAAPSPAAAVSSASAVNVAASDSSTATPLWLRSSPPPAYESLPAQQQQQANDARNRAAGGRR